MTETPAERTHRLNASRGNGVESNQFGHSLRGESTLTRPLPTIVEEHREPTPASVIASINDGSYFLGDLIYVDQNDQLTDEQQTAYLAGDWETFDESVSDTYAEQRHVTALEYAKEATEKLDLEWFDLSDEDQDSILETIFDKDDSEPTKQLLRNTGRQLLRVPLARPFASLARADGMEDPAWGAHSLNSDDPRGRQARIDAVNQILAHRGINAGDPYVAEFISELVDNGPYDWHEGVTLDVIVYARLEEASASPFSDTDAPGSTGRDLKFTDARVVLLDPWNGSGHDVLIPGDITARVTPEHPAVLDSNTDGYGWDEVASVVKGAYEPAGMNSDWVIPAE